MVLLVAAFMSVSNRSPGPLSAAMIGVPGPISVGDSIAGSAAAAGNVDTYPLFVPTPLVARRGF